MAHPDTPGVYLQRLDAQRAAISRLRTDVPGFIGIAERGPLDTPVAVESFRQFRGVFGGFIGGGYLAYSLRAFFENGGQRAYVLRVASRDPAGGAAVASAAFKTSAGGAGWTIAASSEGVWGNALTAAVRETARAQTTMVHAQSTPQFATVTTTAGFETFSLVRIAQHGPGPAIEKVRIVTRVDAAARRIYWIDPEPERRKPFEKGVEGLDPNRTATIESIDYDLTVWASGRLAAIYQKLSLVPQHARYAPLVLGAPDYAQVTASKVPALVTIGAPLLSPSDIPVPLAGADGTAVLLRGGKDGLATLTQDDFIGPALDAAVTDGTIARRGLAAYADLGEVSMLAAPDILIRPEQPPLTLPPDEPEPCPICPPETTDAVPSAIAVPELPPIFSDDAIFAVQAAMIEQAEARRDRIVLLDPPFDAAAGDATGLAPVLAWRDRFDSAFGALYFPWLEAPDPLRVAPTRPLPPSGHVAGLIAANDLAHGVHWAPANVDVAWTQDATVAVNAAMHGVLNSSGINAIRAEFGRALRVRGARTVSSDPSFRFLNVRRLVSMVRVALDISTQWAVFEPNTAATRNLLAASIGEFLRKLWNQGALSGAVPGQAFRVQCDEANNPPASRANGELHVDIAIAPSVPMEFIVLRLGRSADALEIDEQGALAAGMAA
jgi:phage tail sheath protein FI